MSQSTKIRMIIWAVVSVILVLGITVLSYNNSKLDVDTEKIFEGKTEEQIKMEMLELNNYQFEEKPLYTVKTNAYQFDVYRSVNVELTNNYGFYIVGTNLEKYTAADGKDYVKTGFVDFLLYESSPTNNLARLVSNIRLKNIEGTDIMVGFLEMKPSTNATDYQLIIDCSRCEEAFGLTEIDSRSLSSMYDPKTVNSAIALRQATKLSDGYSGDLELAGYAKANPVVVTLVFFVSLIVISGIAFLSFYTIEREVFKQKIDFKTLFDFKKFRK